LLSDIELTAQKVGDSHIDQLSKCVGVGPLALSLAGFGRCQSGEHSIGHPTRGSPFTSLSPGVEDPAVNRLLIVEASSVIVVVTLGGSEGRNGAGTWGNGTILRTEMIRSGRSAVEDFLWVPLMLL
jgi:hypothetical protein